MAYTIEERKFLGSEKTRPATEGDVDSAIAEHEADASPHGSTGKTGTGDLVYGNTPTLISPTISATWDGWVAVTDAWAYASATTITVPSGAASIYQKGDKIKITQTTPKYFYIVAVADTVLTVTGGTDYTLVNAAITLPNYSKVANPQGFPLSFKFSVSASAYLSADQVNLTNNVNTLVALDTALYDNFGVFISATNRFVIPVGHAGKYHIIGSVGLSSVVATHRYIVYIYVNGAQIMYNTVYSSDTNVLGMQVSAYAELSEGDYVQLYVKSNAGVNTVDVDGLVGSSTRLTIQEVMA